MDEKINAFLKTVFFKRLILYTFIILVIFQLRGFWNLFLMIFFVTYIMNELCKFFHFHVSKIIKVPETTVIFITYSIIIIIMIGCVIRYSPVAFEQTKSLIKIFDPSEGSNANINKHISDMLTSIHPYLNKLFTYYNFNPTEKLNQFSGAITNFSYNLIKSIGSWLFNIFLLIILSLFFLMEKNKMKNFVDIFRESKVSFVYHELKPKLVRFYNIFGFMIKTQLIISTINTSITVIAITLLGFTNLFALGIMVFLLGLIPVAGAILSTIPLVLIGFRIGGIAYIIYILILIAVIHALEAYVLFPKISSNFTRLPVFVTLLVLLVSEHLLGPWGLIFGLPLFVFVIESLKINPPAYEPAKSEKIDKPSTPQVS
ncbi:MAG: AI-2E family transporter [Deltaproteobacteria bacterium]